MARDESTQGDRLVVDQTKICDEALNARSVAIRRYTSRLAVVATATLLAAITVAPLFALYVIALSSIPTLNRKLSRPLWAILRTGG